MNRWILTIEGKEYQPKMYADTEEEAKKYFKGENIVDVSPYTDMSYLQDIEYIKSCSEKLAESEINDEIVEKYGVVLENDELYFKISKSKSDGIYYDLVRYYFSPKANLMISSLKRLESATKFREKFFGNVLTCEVHSVRYWGQKKLSKPTELKGVKQSFSACFIPERCNCQCFVNGDDLWVKHRDFFSPVHQPAPEDIGTPLTYRLKKYFNVDKSYLDKFVYADCWGAIVLRNEAWIVFRNAKQSFNRSDRAFAQNLKNSFIRSELLVKKGIWKLGEDWDRFFEDMSNEYGKFLKSGG